MTMTQNEIKIFLKEIPYLKKKELIPPETAENLYIYYSSRLAQPNTAGRRLLICFAVIAAMLISAGLFALIRHSWPNLSIEKKITAAFIALLAGQGITLFAFLGKRSAVWIESASTFLMLMISLSLFMIVKSHHPFIEIEQLFFIWMLLLSPIILIIPSFSATIFYTAALVIAGEYFTVSYWGWYYWLGSAVFAISFIRLQKQIQYRKAADALPWIALIVLAKGIFTFQSGIKPLLQIIAFISLFAGCSHLFRGRLRNGVIAAKKGWLVVIAGGWALILAFAATFSSTWHDILFVPKDFSFTEDFAANTSSYAAAAALFTLQAILFFKTDFKKDFHSCIIGALPPLFFVGMLLYRLPQFSSVYLLPAILFNLVLTAVGIYYIVSGSREYQFAKTNLGMIIILFIIIARLYNTDLALLIQGIIFIVSGALFLIANTILAKKLFIKANRVKKNEQEQNPLFKS